VPLAFLYHTTCDSFWTLNYSHITAGIHARLMGSRTATWVLQHVPLRALLPYHLVQTTPGFLTLRHCTTVPAPPPTALGMLRPPIELLATGRTGGFTATAAKHGEFLSPSRLRLPTATPYLRERRRLYTQLLCHSTYLTFALEQDHTTRTPPAVMYPYAHTLHFSSSPAYSCTTTLRRTSRLG